MRSAFSRPYQRSSSNHQEAMAETPPPPFGPLVLQLEPQDDCKLLEKPVIKDCNYIASYSWLDSKAPTILLPGTLARATKADVAFDES